MSRARNLGRFLGSTSHARALWRRLLCRALARSSPSLRIVGIEDEHGLLLLFADDRVITPYSLATSGHQRRELARALDLCEQIDAPLGRTFVDVGANVGTTTLLALRSGRFTDAVCIEPAPSNLAILERNIRLNELEDRAVIVAAAASDTRGRSMLHLARADSGDHRLGPPDQRVPGRTAVEVDTIPLDALLDGMARPPESVSLVSVDTQGSEGFVLDGAKSLVDAGVPFVIEVWPHGAREAGSLERLLTTVETHFDGFVDLGRRRVHEMVPADRIRSFAARLRGKTTHTDVFLVPKGRGSMLAR